MKRLLSMLMVFILVFSMLPTQVFSTEAEIPDTEIPVVTEAPVSEEEVPVEESIPEEEVPVEEPAPEEEIPAEEPVPEEEVPAEEPVPEEEVPAEDPIPEEETPVAEPAPEEEVPAEEPVSEEVVPVEGEPLPTEAELTEQELELLAAEEEEENEVLPIHFFLASPGNITNPNGSYVNYYGPAGSANNWDGAYTIPGIKDSASWSTMYTQTGIRNVTDEGIVTQYIASYPHGHTAASFKNFGSVTINGTVYYDTEYEIKWVSIMCRDNAHPSSGMRCQQRSFQGEHIHVDGLLVKKVKPGQMLIYKAIPESGISETSAMTFQFKLEKMLQSSLTSPPSSADAVDTSFAPMTLTATIAPGQTQAQITGGSEISFGYYKLTELSNADWQMAGVSLTDASGRTQTDENAEALYICIAPNGTVQYSLNPSGPYTTMRHVALQNERKPVTATYQWRIYNLDGSVSEDLPASLGAHGLPAPATDLPLGSDYVYNTGYVQGTSYHDYENGLLYTFHGWDTYSHSSVFNTDPSAAGYTALDDGDAIASNNKTIPMTANTWINGYWTVSKLSAADAYLLVHKDVVVASGDAQYVNDYLQNIGKMYISIDPGIDKDGDGSSRVDVDYPGAVAEGGYRINVYQYTVPFVFTEYQADVPGYTRTVDITVSGSNLTLTAENGDAATVAIAAEYDPELAPYYLGTVTYTNTYTKNVGTPVTEYPELTLVKHGTDTGLLQPGAVFSLYRDENCTDLVTTFTTGADGTVGIDFAVLLADTEGLQTFYLKETAAPEGYLVDDTVYTLTLTPAETEELRNGTFIQVTTYALDIAVPAGSPAEPIRNAENEQKFSLYVYNDPILGEVTVTKAATGLKEADKALLEVTITIHGPITRDEQGAITDLGREYTLILDSENEWTKLLGQLPLGEYLIHENLAAVHGYTWDMENVVYGALDQEVYNGITSGVFEITADSTDLELTITNTYHKWESAGFEIYKTDPNGTHLSGAVFRLYADEACTVPVTDPGITTTAVTGANGIAWFSGFTVPAGDADGIATYYLREVEAPAGHYLSGTVYRVDIKAVTDAEGTTTFEPKISVKVNGSWVEASGFSNTSDSLTVVNVPVKGQITITKQMIGAPQDLTALTFYVSGPHGYARTVELTSENNWAVTLTDLFLGEYTIIEQSADVPGYSLVTTYTVDGVETRDHATVVLQETNPGQTASGTVFAGTVDITNTYTRNEEVYEIPTTLTVKKVGENGEALAGAVFTLDRLSADGKSVVSSVSFTTGADGTVLFDLLSGYIINGEAIDGTYILSETQAPAGYEPTAATWTVTIREDDGEVRWTLNENKNLFEGFWDWIVGNVSAGTFENGVLTVQNARSRGSLTIRKSVRDTMGMYADESYSFTLDCSDDAFDKTFTLKAGEEITIENIPWGTTYTLTEDTTGAAFTSTITDGGNGRIWAYETLIEVTNTYTYTTHNNPLALVKVDAEDNSLVISGAGFTLYADAALEIPLGREVFSDGNGHLALSIEAAGTYYLAETTTPAGYHPNPVVYVVTAEEKTVVLNAGTSDAVTQLQMHIRIAGLTGTTENQIDYTYAIENTAIKTLAVNVEKVWDDGGYHARPETLEVTLYRDNEPYETVILSEDNSWRYAWTGLTDEYTWSVDEARIPAEYVKAVTNDGNDWTITNTRTPNPVEITVTKAWNHNGGKDLPESITVTLYRDGEAYDTVILSEENSWTYTWTDLTDASQWSVDETNVPAGYTKEITVDGYAFVITNTRTINPVDIHVTKVWVASEGVTHPESVEAVLYRDGEVYDTVVLSLENDWSYSWTGLTDEYTWSVDEKTVPEGYTRNVTSDGYDFTITNTKNFTYIDISVNKVWYGTGVAHPTSVEITLYRDGVVYDTVTLSAENDWNYTWEDLTDEFQWTVDEASVPSGYTKTVRRDGNSFTVVNTHVYNPKTGDFTDLMGMGTLAVIGVAGFGISLLALLTPRRKKETEQ